MFDIYGCYFTYAGFDSSKYDLVFANIDSSRIMTLQGPRNVNTVYSRKNHIQRITNVSYDASPVSFEAEIVTLNGYPIGESYINEIERALFGRNSFGVLSPIEGYDIDPPFINCIFINPERLETEAGVVGYKFTLIADSVLAYEPAKTEVFTFPNTFGGTKRFTVTLDTDMPDYTYPVIDIVMGSTGGNINLYNNTDNAERITGFTGLAASTRFTMDSSLNRISADKYNNFTSRNFIRLLNGNNDFVFTGNIVSISITYNNRKYM